MTSRLQTLLLLLLALPGLVLAPGQAFAVCLCDAVEAEGSCCATVSTDGCCGETAALACCSEDRGVPSEDQRRGGCDDSDGCEGCFELDPTALADLDSTSPDAPETGAHADAPRERLAPPPSFEALGRVTRPPPDPGVRHAGLLPGNAPLRL